jgi:hypothetical protein
MHVPRIGPFLTPGAPGIRSRAPSLVTFSEQPPNEKSPCEQKKNFPLLNFFSYEQQAKNLILRPDVLFSDFRLVEHLLPFWIVVDEIQLDSFRRGVSFLPGHVLREVS